MYCKICGSYDDLKFYPSKRQTLCPYCASSTPRKIGRNDFYKAYFGDDLESVPHSTRKEFYEDYLRSEHGFDEYLNATTNY